MFEQFAVQFKEDMIIEKWINGTEWLVNSYKVNLIILDSMIIGFG